VPFGMARFVPFEIVLQDYGRGDRIDGMLLFSSPHDAPKTFFGFEAGKALILKLHLDSESVGKLGGEISRMPRHWTFGSVHIDRQSHYNAVYLAATECVSYSLQIGAE
jgi:hypothetical protein